MLGQPLEDAHTCDSRVPAPEALDGVVQPGRDELPGAKDGIGEQVADVGQAFELDLLRTALQRSQIELRSLVRRLRSLHEGDACDAPRAAGVAQCPGVLRRGQRHRTVPLFRSHAGLRQPRLGVGRPQAQELVECNPCEAEIPLVAATQAILGQSNGRGGVAWFRAQSGQELVAGAIGGRLVAAAPAHADERVLLKTRRQLRVRHRIARIPGDEHLQEHPARDGLRSRGEGVAQLGGDR